MFLIVYVIAAYSFDIIVVFSSQIHLIQFFFINIWREKRNKWIWLENTTMLTKNELL